MAPYVRSGASRRRRNRPYKPVASSGGRLAVVSIPGEAASDLLPRDPGERILALEDIQDPGNLGTLIRSAAAFDFSGIVCSDKCADPFSPKAIQSSCGAIVSVWVRRIPDLSPALAALRAGGYRIVAADVGGKPVGGARIAGGKTVIVLGNEGNGLSERILRTADETIRIPINGLKVESLNVAGTGAILMFLSRFLDGNAGASLSF